MPIKRRRALSRTVTISPEAMARWREIRPDGIELQGNCGILSDDDLADALGLPTLLWLWEVADAYHALESQLTLNG